MCPKIVIHKTSYFRKMKMIVLSLVFVIPLILHSYNCMVYGLANEGKLSLL